MVPLYQLFLIACVLTAGCGPAPQPSRSPLDSPENHYNSGLASVEAGRLMEAQGSFERAAALDDDFAGAYVGYALVAITQGEFFTARQQIEKALHKDNDYADAFIARGRLLVAEGSQRGFDSSDWLDDALRSFDRAIVLRPTDGRAYYYRGTAYLGAQDLQAAEEAFLKVQALKRGPLIGKAMEQVSLIQKVRRAAPGSTWGTRLGLVTQISRAELTVLLLEELKLVDLVRQRRPQERQMKFRTPEEAVPIPVTPSDIEFSWAQPWIENILQIGVPGLEIVNGEFRPDEPITRSNYARVNEGILTLITGDRELSTKYIGERSPFPDVRSDSYAFNAIALNVNRGIMSVDKLSGQFRPDAPVTGAEALSIVRELQNAVRMEF